MAADALAGLAVLVIFVTVASAACALTPYRDDWPAWTK